ncbi:hypothetical protein FOZ61_008212 [Perkinsus olseni]|uniref:Uncharacterized protein n=1 Tax=Perkinsus olseni TaxID=32597 RepID=A0A7J6MFJ5_PEROL|nr:hypothetical protein FOZ61_008212 [Perkinsus olseni]KAF4670187.1 hypothetical protein FOL46_000971 [Perkinsus olseni]
MPRRLVKHEELDTACDLPVTVVNLFRMGLVCGVLAVYIPHSLSTEMGDGDSPELLASACTNSLPHPPGYPLYTILLQLWLGLGLNPHLLSACFGALASAAVFDAVLLLSMTVCSGALPLIFGITTAAHYSLATLRFHTVVEVFPLNSALLSWTFYFGTRWLLRSPGQCPWQCGLLMGLAASNQHTSLLFLPSFIFIALRRLPWSAVLKLGVCFAVGLLPYIYLPFLQGEMSWPTASMLRHILRGDYGTLSLGSATNPHANDDRVTLIAVVGAFVEDTGILSLCLGILMSVVALRCETNVRIITLVCVTSFLIYLTVFSWMANLSLESSLLRNSVYPRFWVQPLLPLHLITGVGLATLWGSGRRIAKALALCLAFVWGIEGLAHHLPTDLAHSRVDYYSSFLQALPPRSVVVTTGDMPAYAMKYLLGCTARRSDVRTVSEAELSSRYWWESSQRRHILPGLSHLPVPNSAENLKILMTTALRENRPLFFVHLPSFMSAGYAPDYFGPDRLVQGLTLYPTGPAIRVYATEAAPKTWKALRDYQRRLAQSGSIFEGHELREGTFEAALFARQCTQFEYGMAALLQFDATAEDYAALAQDVEGWIAQCDDASLLDPHTGLATASLRVSPESWRAIGWIFSRLPQGERKAALYLERYLQFVDELDVGNPEIERIRDYVAAVQRLIPDKSNISV